MASFDWAPFITDGAARPDAISGLTTDFAAAMQRMIASAPPNIREGLLLSSAYRSPERQAELWQAALVKYGSPEEARKWVAPPGRSQHNQGQAADLRFASDDVRAWVHQNAGNYGLHFPLSNEPWHIEIAGSRGGVRPTAPSTTDTLQPTGPAEQQRNAFYTAPPRPSFTPLDPNAFAVAQNALAPQPFEQPQNYLTRRL